MAKTATMASGLVAKGGDIDASAEAALAADVPEIIPLRLRVPPECNGWRLDHFIKHRIKRLSRSRIQTIIATQVVLSDGRRPRPAMGVHAGETVVVNRPAPIEPDVPREFEVLAEDDTFIAIDKPAGLPIHCTAKFYKNTLTWILRQRWPAESLDVCHRLDRETSGVLLIARDHAARSVLKQAFAQRAVSKEYLALVHGVPSARTGVIDAPMRLRDTQTHIMMGVAADGARSVTRYEVVQAYPRHALLRLAPETGRQHQIRVHLAHVGHPVVGDKLYGTGEEAFIAYCDEGLTPALLARFDGLPRHALHAHKLTFPHPKTGLPVTVQSPWPPDLADYVRLHAAGE